MKKKIVSVFLLAAVLAAGVCAFTACGASSGDVVKTYMEASLSFDAEKAVDCFYFKSDALKKETKETLDAGFKAITGALESVSAKITDFKYEKISDMTEAELEAYDVKEGDKVEAGESGKVTYSATVKLKVAGTETESKVSNQQMTVKIIKISGKWYIDYNSVEE